MNDTQPWYVSKGVWGGLVALIAAGAGLLHYTISPADQQSLIDALTAAGGALGSILAIYGRITATKQISGS
jgi:hypothetical protein